MTEHAGRRFAAELDALLAQEAHAGAVATLAGWIRDLKGEDWAAATGLIFSQSTSYARVATGPTWALYSKIAKRAHHYICEMAPPVRAKRKAKGAANGS